MTPPMLQTLPPPVVLLDLDGTLTDSRPGILASWHATLRTLGHEPSRAGDLTFVIGPPVEDSLARVLPLYDEDTSPERVAEVAAIFRAHYGANGLLDNSVYDGIPDALDQLRAAGAELVVATAKRTEYAVRILDHFGLSPRLRAIYGSEPGGALDEKAELLRHVLHHEGIDPARAVMVGDRRYDMTGAHANKLRGIGVLWGYGTRDELEQAGADALAASPHDIPRLALAQLKAAAR